jgi:hypothetical protein
MYQTITSDTTSLISTSTRLFFTINIPKNYNISIHRTRQHIANHVTHTKKTRHNYLPNIILHSWNKICINCNTMTKYRPYAATPRAFPVSCYSRVSGFGCNNISNIIAASISKSYNGLFATMHTSTHKELIRGTPLFSYFFIIVEYWRSFLH